FDSSLFGWMRGGLAHVSIGASMFFAENSGSAVADIAALGSILIPAMKSKGYPAPLAAAIMSSAATLAAIIPPSIPMILYAVMAETSVVQMFVAGIVPGVLGGLGLMGMAYWFARRFNLPIAERIQAPQALAHTITELTTNKWFVLALLNLLFLLLGMFLHSAAAIILVVPVVMPLVRSVGIDPIHFGIVVTVNLGIGQQTPPVASV